MDKPAMTIPAHSVKKLLCISMYTEIGGGEVGLYQLLKNLDRSKVEPMLVVNGEGSLPSMVRELGINVEVVPFDVVMLKNLFAPKSFSENLRAAFTLRKLIIDYRVDAIVCSDLLALLLLLPSILLRRLPIIYNVIFYYEPIRLILFNLLALCFVKKIVLLSNAMRVNFRTHTVGLQKRLTTSYWGVDTSMFHPRPHKERLAMRSRLGLPLDKKIIGFVGRYEVWKGHHTFLDAAERLLEQRDDLIFLIVGGGMTESIIPAVRSYHTAIMTRVNTMNKGDRIVTWDHRSDIPEVMAALDVFVCPSDREPYGLVVLEAVASGIPVVASRTVGALEVVQDLPMVLVSNPSDGASFAANIAKMLEKQPLDAAPGAEVATALGRANWPAFGRLVEDALHL